jgi:hypothetical protein
VEQMGQGCGVVQYEVARSVTAGATSSMGTKDRGGARTTLVEMGQFVGLPGHLGHKGFRLNSETRTIKLP